MHKQSVLSIAGSDPCGGAGVQADLKSFSYLGLHGTAVVTCVTAQNTQHVTDVYPLPLSIIEHQLDALFDDVPLHWIKTGMLHNESIIKTISNRLISHHITPVVDPVMTATTGDDLADDSFLSALQKHLFPHTILLTANIPEASTIAAKNIKSISDMKEACTIIHAQDVQNVLIKGGHLSGSDSVDILYDGHRFYEYSLPRLSTQKTHGTGCTLSALITGYLALKNTLQESVKKAKFTVWNMLHEHYQIGKGSHILNHNLRPQDSMDFGSKEHFQTWFELHQAIQQLLTILPPSFLPEVGMNFAYALPTAQTLQDVCSINGRIIKTMHQPVVCGTLCFGASKHVASIVLAAHALDPTIHVYQKAEVLIGTFDRTQEPKTAASTMEWGTTQAIQQLKKTPDLIYDTGSPGKEPMIRILGQNPSDVLVKLQKIISIL